MTTREAVVTCAVVVAAAHGAVGLYGAYRWYRVEESRVFWLALRSVQVGAVFFALLVAGLSATGHQPRRDLFYLYAFLPLVIGLLAEQLRVAAAEAVLDARGLADAQAVGLLSGADQRSVVMAIVRRELGVMAAGCLVICFLLARAAGTW